MKVGNYLFVKKVNKEITDYHCANIILDWFCYAAGTNISFQMDT